MNAIMEAMKENNLRLVYEDKWMVWSNIYNTWTVMQRKKHKHSNTTLIVTVHEELAVRKLLEKDY